MESTDQSITSDEQNKNLVHPAYPTSDFIPVGQLVQNPSLNQPSQPVFYNNMQYPAQMPVQRNINREERKEDARVQQLRQNAQVLQINENQKIISRDPVIAKCHHCNQTGVTTVRRQNGLLIYASVVMCCLIGMGPFSLVPWCVGECKDTIHECHYCGNVITKVKRHENL